MKQMLIAFCFASMLIGFSLGILLTSWALDPVPLALSCCESSTASDPPEQTRSVEQRYCVEV